MYILPTSVMNSGKNLPKSASALGLANYTKDFFLFLVFFANFPLTAQILSPADLTPLNVLSPIMASTLLEPQPNFYTSAATFRQQIHYQGKNICQPGKPPATIPSTLPVGNWELGSW